MTERLASLSVVKTWLDVSDDGADSLLRILIEGASQFVLSYIGRQTFTSQTYVDNFRGGGKANAILKHWPLIEVTKVFVAGATITPATMGYNQVPLAGFMQGDDNLEGPGEVRLFGQYFYAGAAAQVTYRAGYEATQRMLVPDTGGLFTTARGQWIANIRVAVAGVTLTEVVGTPGAGQYAVNEDGQYTFGDPAGTVVDITYSYCPTDVSVAVMELVGETYRRKERIGQISKSIGGQQTVAFSQKDMNETVRVMLQPYRRVVPL